MSAQWHPLPEPCCSLTVAMPLQSPVAVLTGLPGKRWRRDAGVVLQGAQRTAPHGAV